MSKTIKYLLFVFLVFTVTAFTQSRKNLDVFYSLIDSSISLLPENIPENSYSIYTGSNKLIYNYIYNKFSSKYGIDTSDEGISISYVVEDIKLTYGEIFRKKFLGAYYIERNFLLDGNFVLPAVGESREFTFTFRDTVEFEDVEKLENLNHPFTRSDIPAEPFFEGLLEPVLAIGTAATAVVLFFILRSK